MVPGLGELHQRLKEDRPMTDLGPGVASVGQDVTDS